MTKQRPSVILIRQTQEVFFLCYNLSWCKQGTFRINGGKPMRTKITLECTECKQRNYNTTKNKQTQPDRVETKKYCKFCKKHTIHKETK